MNLELNWRFEIFQTFETDSMANFKFDYLESNHSIFGLSTIFNLK